MLEKEGKRKRGAGREMREWGERRQLEIEMTDRLTVAFSATVFEVREMSELASEDGRLVTEAARPRLSRRMMHFIAMAQVMGY